MTRGGWGHIRSPVGLSAPTLHDPASQAPTQLRQEGRPALVEDGRGHLQDDPVAVGDERVHLPVEVAEHLRQLAAPRGARVALRRRAEGTEVELVLAQRGECQRPQRVGLQVPSQVQQDSCAGEGGQVVDARMLVGVQRPSPPDIDTRGGAAPAGMGQQGLAVEVTPRHRLSLTVPHLAPTPDPRPVETSVGGDGTHPRPDVPPTSRGRGVR